MNLQSTARLHAVEEKVELEGDRKRFPELRSKSSYRPPKMPKLPNPSMGLSKNRKLGHFPSNPSLPRLSTAGTRTRRQETTPVEARGLGKPGPGAAKVGIQTPKNKFGNVKHLKRAMVRDDHKDRHLGIDKLKDEMKETYKHHRDNVDAGKFPSEGTEPPQTGAYSARHTPKDKFFVESDKDKITSTGTSEGVEKSWFSRKHKAAPGERVHPLTKGNFRPVKRVIGDLTPEQIKKFKEVRERYERGELEADFDGEPSATMQHAHIQPMQVFHPPSLTKRNKATRVPTDSPGETDDKYLDVTKRNSQQTHEERMKLLKRQPPPGKIPAHTTLIPEHAGVFLPTSMMSAERKFKSRPVNWDKQPRNRTSYARRGCI